MDHTNNRPPPAWAMPAPPPTWQAAVLTRRGMLPTDVPLIHSPNQEGVAGAADRNALRAAFARWRQHDNVMMAGKVSILTVIHVTAAYFGQSATELIGSASHRRQICIARWAVHLLARDICKIKTVCMARIMKVDPTTVTHSRTRGAERVRKDPAFARAVASLKTLLTDGQQK